MPSILVAVDVAQREIHLSDVVWYGKILNKRPGAAQYYPDTIRRAIESPTRIYADRMHLDRRCYFLGLGTYDRRGVERQLKIVVEFPGGLARTHRGDVVTVFPCDGPSAGEVQEWP